MRLFSNWRSYITQKIREALHVPGWTISWHEKIDGRWVHRIEVKTELSITDNINLLPKGKNPIANVAIFDCALSISECRQLLIEAKTNMGDIYTTCQSELLHFYRMGDYYAEGAEGEAGAGAGAGVTVIPH